MQENMIVFSCIRKMEKSKNYGGVVDKYPYSTTYAYRIYLA